VVLVLVVAPVRDLVVEVVLVVAPVRDLVVEAVLAVAPVLDLAVEVVLDLVAEVALAVEVVLEVLRTLLASLEQQRGLELERELEQEQVQKRQEVNLAALALVVVEAVLVVAPALAVKLDQILALLPMKLDPAPVAVLRLLKLKPNLPKLPNRKIKPPSLLRKPLSRTPKTSNRLLVSFLRRTVKAFSEKRVPPDTFLSSVKKRNCSMPRNKEGRAK
jgi:hypothetical protein